MSLAFLPLRFRPPLRAVLHGATGWPPLQTVAAVIAIILLAVAFGGLVVLLLLLA